MYPPMIPYPIMACRSLDDVDATLPPRPMTSQSYAGDSVALKRRCDFDERNIAPLNKHRCIEPFSGYPREDQQDESQPPPPPSKDFFSEEDSPPPPPIFKDYLSEAIANDDNMDSQPPPLPVRDFESSVVVIDDSQQSQPPSLTGRDFISTPIKVIEENIEESQPPPPPSRDYSDQRATEDRNAIPPIPRINNLNGIREIEVDSASFNTEPDQGAHPPTGNTLYAICSQGRESYRIEDSAAQMHNANIASQSSMVSAISLDSLAIPNYLLPPTKETVTRRSLPTNLNKGAQIKNLPPWPMLREEPRRSTAYPTSFARPALPTSYNTSNANKVLQGPVQTATDITPTIRQYSVNDSWDTTAVIEVPENPVTAKAFINEIPTEPISLTNALVNDKAGNNIKSVESSEEEVLSDDDEAPPSPASDYVQTKENQTVTVDNMEPREEHPAALSTQERADLSYVCAGMSLTVEEAPTATADDNDQMRNAAEKLLEVENETAKKEQPAALSTQERADISFICQSPVPLVPEQQVTSKVFSDAEKVKFEPLSSQQRRDLSFICSGLELTIEEAPAEAPTGNTPELSTNTNQINNAVIVKVEPLSSQQRRDLSFICSGLELTIEEAPTVSTVDSVQLQKVVEQPLTNEENRNSPPEQSTILSNQQSDDLRITCEEDIVTTIQATLTTSLQSAQVSLLPSALQRPIKEELEECNLVIDEDVNSTLENANQAEVNNDMGNAEDYSLLNTDDEPIESVRSQVIDDRQRSMLEFSSFVDTQGTTGSKILCNIMRETGSSLEDTLVIGLNFHPSYENFDQDVISAVHAANTQYRIPEEYRRYPPDYGRLVPEYPRSYGYSTGAGHPAPYYRDQGYLREPIYVRGAGACGRGSNYVSSRPSTVHSHPGYLAEPSVILNPGRLAMDYRRGPCGRTAYVPRAAPSHQPSHANSKSRPPSKRPQKSPVFRYGSSLPEALYDYEVWARKEDRKRMMRRVIGVAFALLAISVIVAAGVVLAAINY